MSNIIEMRNTDIREGQREGGCIDTQAEAEFGRGEREKQAEALRGLRFLRSLPKSAFESLEFIYNRDKNKG